MQVDAGVESVLSVVEAHHGLLGLGGARARTVLGREVVASRSLTTFGTGFAHPNEAMISIQTLHLTAAAFRFFGFNGPPAAAAAERAVCAV